MDTIYKKLTITLLEKILKEFRKFCDDNGINLSSRIAILIKEDLGKLKIRGRYKDILVRSVNIDLLKIKDFII